MKKSNIKEGDTVEISSSDEKIKGTLLPSSDPKTLILKLSSGYNIGIKKSKIKSIKLIKKVKIKKIKAKEHKQKSSLPLIYILHVGGTLAARVDYDTGAVIAKFTPEEILEHIPEIKHIAQIKCKLVSNMMSESMRFGHYNLIAKEIQNSLKDSPKGIIITHGTDTLAYTSAALSFILENINLPVILVGSQRSSDRGSSDASMNLICAAKFIAQTDFKGIAICMHKNMEDKYCNILPALKTKKLHTSRRDAFKAVNDSIIADVSFNDNEIKFISKPNYNPKEKLKLKLFKENLKISILRSHTNIVPEDIFYYKSHDGLIIEGTGLGHFQTKSFDKISEINEKNKKALSSIIKNGCITVLTSQCVFGKVNMNVYSPARELLEIGVIPGDDMLTETAFIKLAWLLSNYKKSEIKKLITQNLRNEINPRLKTEFLE